MKSRGLVLGVLAGFLGLMLFCGPAFAHDHGGVFWYTSSTGPYQDECAEPYAYCNTPFHPYPYNHTPGACGPFLYGPNGHLHGAPVVVRQEVRREEVQREREAPPAPEPPPPPAPRSQPEGD